MQDIGLWSPIHATRRAGSLAGGKMTTWLRDVRLGIVGSASANISSTAWMGLWTWRVSILVTPVTMVAFAIEFERVSREFRDFLLDVAGLFRKDIVIALIIVTGGGVIVGLLFVLLVWCVITGMILATLTLALPAAFGLAASLGRTIRGADPRPDGTLLKVALGNAALAVVLLGISLGWAITALFPLVAYGLVKAAHKTWPAQPPLDNGGQPVEIEECTRCALKLLAGLDECPRCHHPPPR